MVGHIVGKGYGGMPVFCHDSHRDFRRVSGKPAPIHRKPVSLGEVKKHRCIAACGDEATGWRLRLQTIRPEMSFAFDKPNAILSIENGLRAAIRFKQWRRGRKLLERTASRLATGAIANDACYWCANSLDAPAATGASRDPGGRRSVRHRKILFRDVGRRRQCRVTLPGFARTAPGHDGFGLSLRLESQDAGETVPVRRPHFRIQQARRLLAIQYIQHLLSSDLRDVVPRLTRDTSGVRADDDVVEVQQRMV